MESKRNMENVETICDIEIYVIVMLCALVVHFQNILYSGILSLQINAINPLAKTRV